jgi:hypothetical protein
MWHTYARLGLALIAESLAPEIYLPVSHQIHYSLIGLWNLRLSLPLKFVPSSTTLLLISA